MGGTCSQNFCVVKLKVVPVRNMKAHRVSVSAAALILKLRTRWRRMVGFTPGLFFPRNDSLVKGAHVAMKCD